MFLRNSFRTLSIALASITLAVVSMLWISETTTTVVNDELSSQSIPSQDPIASNPHDLKHSATDQAEINLGSAHPEEAHTIATAPDNTEIKASVIQEILPQPEAKIIVAAATPEAKVAEETSTAEEAKLEKDISKAKKENMDVQEPATETLQTSSSIPSSTPTQVQAQSASGIQVIEFVLATAIEAREPHGIVETFTKEDQKAYVFARLSSEKDSQVSFVWFRDGREVSRFTTNVHAAKRWRTYAATAMRTGTWKVQLVSGTEVLAERSFTVQ